jgi:hypothetical protein
MAVAKSGFVVLSVAKNLYDCLGDPSLRSGRHVLQHVFLVLSSDFATAMIYHISTAAGKDSNYAYYRALDFALQTGWDEFLDAYAE